LPISNFSIFPSGYLLENKKASQLSGLFLILLFSLGSGFNATDTNFFSSSVNFFGLEIDSKSSARGNIRMASRISAAGSSSANLADFSHIFKI